MQEKVRAIIKGGRGAKDLIGRPGGFNEHYLSSSSHSAAETGSNVPESDSASFTGEAGGGKPWKKHHNRNKKEKIKRTHKA